MGSTFDPRDADPTPRFSPGLANGEVLARLAADYALRCDTEAATIGRDMPGRADKCREYAIAMRALMIEFRKWNGKSPPPPDARSETWGRYQDTRAQIDLMRLPAGELTS